MATKKRSELEETLMTPANIERVIALLEPTDGSKPGTKKLACEMLGMAYNTTRLGTIIENYKDKQAKEKARRAELRGKPATEDDIKYVISEYLEGATIDGISTSLYRSANFVRKILEDNAVPIRVMGHSYNNPQEVPADAVRERFVVGTKAYSMRYDSKCLIEKEIFDTRNLGYIYRVWLLAEKWQQ